jgi:ketosteroid isomerase-like protein
MSQENVQTMRRGVDAFDRRDKEAWLATFAPDAVMVPAHEWPENAPIRGAEAIWDFYVDVNAAWEEDPYELGEIVEARDDAVIANARRESRGKASGAGVTFSYWLVVTFRHGKTIRVEWFTTRAGALEAVGLG